MAGQATAEGGSGRRCSAAVLRRVPGAGGGGPVRAVGGGPAAGAGTVGRRPGAGGEGPVRAVGGGPAAGARTAGRRRRVGGGKVWESERDRVEDEWTWPWTSV